MEVDWTKLCISAALTLLFAVLLPRLVKHQRQRSLNAKMPPEGRVRELAQEVKQLRERQAGYQDQLAYLLRAGVDRQIAEMLLAKIEARQL